MEKQVGTIFWKQMWQACQKTNVQATHIIIMCPPTQKNTRVRTLNNNVCDEIRLVLSMTMKMKMKMLGSSGKDELFIWPILLKSMVVHLIYFSWTKCCLSVCCCLSFMLLFFFTSFGSARKEPIDFSTVIVIR